MKTIAIPKFLPGNETLPEYVPPYKTFSAGSIGNKYFYIITF